MSETSSVPALELSGIRKSFGATDGYRFINGVLDKIYKAMQASASPSGDQ